MRIAKLSNRAPPPPVKSEGGEIVIEQPKQRTHRRHVSISYEILVPRDAQVKVRSESGDVHVSGVSGPVDATSETGVVTLAAIRTATNAVNGS